MKVRLPDMVKKQFVSAHLPYFHQLFRIPAMNENARLSIYLVNRHLPINLFSRYASLKIDKHLFPHICILIYLNVYWVEPSTILTNQLLVCDGCSHVNNYHFSLLYRDLVYWK